MSETRGPIVHFLEFRKRVIYCLLTYLLILTPLIFWASPLYAWLTGYLIHPIPQANLIATEVTATFITPLKLAFFISFLLSLPFFLLQAWGFIAPALYTHEKRPIKWLSLISTLLFYSGVGFAYFVVCPLALQFFAYMAPSNVQVMTDMNHYLNFITKMALSFGFAFQVPIFVCVLLMSGFCDIKTLKQKRSYVIVGAFIIGMVLTPPDVISQCLLAVPLIGLFELGLLLSLWLTNQNHSQPTKL